MLFTARAAGPKGLSARSRNAAAINTTHKAVAAFTINHQTMSVPFPLGKCPMHCHVTGGIKNRPLGGRLREPGLLTRCNRKSARPRRPNSFGSLGLQMRRLSGFAPASIANRRNAPCVLHLLSRVITSFPTTPAI